MAKMVVKGISEYQNALRKLIETSEGSVKKAVYEGAKVIADACAEGIRGLPTDEGWGTKDRPLRGLRPTEKQGLEESFGLSKIHNEDGFINTKAGFSGYNDFPTKKYPNGQPNVLIARVIESGTSFREKHPFIRPAVGRSKNKAIYYMDEQIKKDIRDKGF